MVGCNSRHPPNIAPVHPSPALVRAHADPDASATSASSGLPEDQYLCTGLDALLTREPDLMDAMALMHSRIRRVFYVHCEEGGGALGSALSLHTMRALNHRARVFQVTPHPSTHPSINPKQVAKTYSAHDCSSL